MNQKGQALMETAAFFLAFPVLAVCLLGLTQWFTIRQKVLMGAREAALLYSSGRMTPDEVRAQVNRYLTTGSPALDPGGIQIDIGRYGNFFIQTIYGLDQITVRYTKNSNWYQNIGLNSTMEETCIVKHAPHYGPPVQTLLGPPIPY